MNENVKKYFKIGILVASVIMILSTFLPFVSVLGYQLSLLFADGSQMADGIILVVLAALCIVFTLINKRILVLVCSALAFVMSIYEMTQLDQFGSLVSKGIGYWLLLLSAIALLVLAILNFVPSRKSE